MLPSSFAASSFPIRGSKSCLHIVELLGDTVTVNVSSLFCSPPLWPRVVTRHVEGNRKVRNVLPPDLQETVVSIFMVESPPTPLYLLGNVQSGKKVRKNFNPSEGSQAGRDSLSEPPTYLRNIQTGKSKKKFQSFGGVPGWKRKLDHSPLLI